MRGVCESESECGGGGLASRGGVCAWGGDLAMDLAWFVLVVRPLVAFKKLLAIQQAPWVFSGGVLRLDFEGQLDTR